MVDFKSKISLCRPRESGAVPVDDYSVAWCDELTERLESDRGRIVNSAAVRRLQQKTQVFPLERNAAVRSRLTHSLEVQQVGRFIVRTLYRQLGSQAVEHGLDGLERALESLVEMACLTHDIGNPPFGHFGEFAIGDWFVSRLDALFDAAVPTSVGDGELRARMLTDLKAFEGNAQAIRLAMRLLRLNLTYTQSAGMLKYVRAAYQAKPETGSAGAYLHKKPGFYLSEERFVGELRKVLGMAPGTRHPLVYVMEAADDISYCLADIEDSVEKGILDIERLADLLRKEFARHGDPHAAIPGAKGSFAQLIALALKAHDEEPINKAGEFFIRLRVLMIHPLVKYAAGQFIENIETVFAGTLDRALLEDDSLACAIVQTFKNVAARHVFNDAEVETLHLQGLRILQGILDTYAPLLRVDAGVFKALTEGAYRARPDLQMLARRLPSQQIKAYFEALEENGEEQRELWEFYHRCRILQDFVSGMTDQQAHDEYRALMAL
ncbi:dGTPase [Pseudomonas sp. LRF_L74]|uniref:dGTPase n=1 Tax=Pseudomonas sp. LRF_L74 TaxID=3369422 RepID=UPI003F5DDC27